MASFRDINIEIALKMNKFESNITKATRRISGFSSKVALAGKTGETR